MLAAVAFLMALPLGIGRAQVSAPTSQTNDEAAIRQVVADFSAGWNRHDAHAMFSALADDGDFVTWQGVRFHGRKAYEDYHVILLAETPEPDAPD